MKKSLGLLVLVVLLSTLASSTVSVTKVKAATLTLSIVSPHTEGIKKEYEAAFDTYYFAKTGNHVTIKWVDIGGTSDISTYLDSAYAANRETTSNIDVWWGGGVSPFIYQKGENHLYPYRISDDVLGPIPKDISGIPMYDTSDYTWYGSALSGFGIIYNKAVLQIKGLPTPRTWEDLTDPNLRGWVISADPRHSGSTHMCYEIMMQGYGWERGLRISTLLSANVKSWPQSSGLVPTAVASGDVAYGLCIDYYAWAQVAKVGADKIGYVMPDGLTVINPDSIAILKGAPNLDLAKEFEKFVLSKDGQKLLMLPVNATGGPKNYLLGRMCVVPSIYDELGNRSVVPINPFKVKSQLPYNATLDSLRYSLLSDTIGSMMIDTQSDLTSVWGEIIDANKTVTNAGITSTNIATAVDTMCKAPTTERESLTLAISWSNQTVRNQYITQWHDFALRKYKDASAYAKLATTEVSQRQFQLLVQRLESEKQNNLYMGLGGGLIVGVVIGVAIAYYATRRKEIAAVKA